MPDRAPRASIRDVAQADPAEVLVLDEFRLHVADSDGVAARIVWAASKGSRDPVPLLTSIDDPCDVATVRTAIDQDCSDDRGERAALAPFVASWRPARRYRPRIAESAEAPPIHYRLAVTGSGMNDIVNIHPRGPAPAQPATGHLALLWIGTPLGTHAGLLVLVGHYGDGAFAVGRDVSGWPLPLSRDLGVRIYEGSCQAVLPAELH